ncbi:alpha/beta hydrolase [Streptomyces phaeoluteigriseus]|uniref:Alpha/beta hydrolase n=1 Tax=Streptomyces phaeoluteigriseus TaxID=114686 RepID=A0ABY4ZHL2_9ACTN|nr:alpha/beta fold hydrolase [Streptomyces phaeoluteigriseus]USQ88396.1 alpha/beta hydrolase [Streptomyces phaeoluteigriseus]
MRLHTQEWGTGDRLAVLVHGIMTDHRTWHELAPVLTGRGYRVLAVDLRGHGASGRGAYAPALFAEDLLETLPRHPELALGHSLGALALALAVEELAPARAVYSEPAWRLSGSEGGLDPAFFTLFKRSPELLTSFSRPRDDAAAEAAERLTTGRLTTERLTVEHLGAERPTAERVTVEHLGAERPTAERLTVEHLGAERPTAERLTVEHLGAERPTGEGPTTERPTAQRLTTEQLAAERLTFERLALDAWDENTALALSAHRLVDHTPEKAVVPSLVQVSDPSMLVSAQGRVELGRRGFEVRTVPDAPHAIHRDRFDAFVESLSGWL